MRRGRAACLCAASALLLAALCLMLMHLLPKDGTRALVALDAPNAAPWALLEPEPLTGPVDVNAAEADELDTLPGVGPVLARRIVEEREQNGPFFYPEDLMNVSGIGERTLEKLLAHIRLP